MVITNFLNLFPAQGRSVFGTNGFQNINSIQKNPMNNTLNQIAENTVVSTEQEGKTQRTDSCSLLEALKAEGSGDSPLSGVSDEGLHLLRWIYEDGARVSANMEADLTEYRDQLSSFDQSIQRYQQILDGTSDLPEDLSMEDVESLLKATQSARETFLRDGAYQLNQRNQKRGEELQSTYSKYADLVDDTFSKGLEQFSWEIDADAENIYGEVDRVRSAAHRATETFKKGMSMIDAELARRNYKDDPYQAYFERQKTMGNDYISPRNNVSIFRETYGAVREILLQAVDGKDHADQQI